MSKVYVLKMWLSCGANSNGDLDRFDQRFTPRLRREWDVMVFDESIDLVDELDHILFNCCNNSALVNVEMRKDLTNPVKTRAFYKSTWTVANGRHEVGRNVMAQLEDGTTVPWTFLGEDGAIGVQVHASWRLVPVRS